MFDFEAVWIIISIYTIGVMLCFDIIDPSLIEDDDEGDDDLIED